MKRYLFLLISAVLFGFSSLTALAYAGGNFGLNTTAGKASFITGNPANDTVEGLFGQVVTLGLSMMAFFFFFLMIYGGVRWMTARGQEEFVTKGKNIIEAGIIGLIIMLGAYAIANFVLDRLK